MSMTRRRLLGLTGAVGVLGALALPGAALATPAPEERFTLLRDGSTIVIYDANDGPVYMRAGDREIMTPGSAERLGALLTVVRDHPEPGVFEIRLPAPAEQPAAGR